jgi:arginyl-tRNA synthetase
MQNPWTALRQSIIDAVKKTAKLDISAHLEEPPRIADFALPCHLLAKKLRKSPEQLAADLAAGLKIKYLKTRAVGPYLNFHIDWKTFAQMLLRTIDTGYGTQRARKTAVIDFCSPNPAHPFHMGTTRSMLIGEALARILASQGWSVKRLCYINDLGKQAATLLVGLRTLAKAKKPAGKADVWLGNIYFELNRQAEETADVAAEIERTLALYERADPVIRALGRKAFGWAIAGFRQNWRELGIKFDHIVFESAFIADSQKIVSLAMRRGIAFKSDSATVLGLRKHGLPDTIILRSDGTGLYLTRELPFALWRDRMFKPDLNIYVVAEDQKLHFQQLFKTLELLGYSKLAAKSVHLAFSMVLLEGRRMSARRGWMVLWDELLEEGMKKASSEVERRWPELSERAKARRARMIALAAIIYFILKYAPDKPVNFIWNKALAFEGDTGPYLQYTHARACSILRKAKVKVRKFSAAALRDERERRVLKLLAQYPAVLAKAARDLRPHYLAGYLHSLADAFNEFYQALPVLRADEGLRAARLRLVSAVRTVLRSGLGLLNITAPKKM